MLVHNRCRDLTSQTLVTKKSGLKIRLISINSSRWLKVKSISSYTRSASCSQMLKSTSESENSRVKRNKQSASSTFKRKEMASIKLLAKTIWAFSFANSMMKLLMLIVWVTWLLYLPSTIRLKAKSMTQWDSLQLLESLAEPRTSLKRL